jgi:hypothetical protein
MTTFVSAVLMIYLVSWLAYIGGAKGTRFAFVLWFPLTATALIGSWYWLSAACDCIKIAISGGGGGHGGPSVGFGAFADLIIIVVLAGCPISVIIGLWQRPKWGSCRWTIVVPTILGYIGLVAAYDAIAQDATPKAETVGGLSCSFAVSPAANKSAELISVEMILTNESHEAIRVCTQCMPWRSGSNGKCSVLMTPNSWKSDGPMEAQLSRHIETIVPGASVRIPFQMERGPDGKIEITGRYSVNADFAKRMKIWGGTVEAKKFTGHVP